MSLYLVTIGLILAIALIGIAIDALYRRFARDNPQLGPFRDSHCGSCSSEGACGGSCQR